MKKHFALTLASVLLFALTLQAAPEVKYSGALEVASGTPHKDGIAGVMNVYFDGQTLSKVTMQTQKPVFGKKDFASKEQMDLSTTEGALFHVALIFTFQGPPHKWAFTYLLKSADQGKTFEGTLFRVPGSLKEIAKSLQEGVMPTGSKEIGKGTLGVVQ